MTVSIAADTSGRLRRMPRVSWVPRLDLVRQDLGVRRHQQDVVEGEGFLEDAQHGRIRPVRKEARNCTRRDRPGETAAPPCRRGRVR